MHRIELAHFSEKNNCIDAKIKSVFNLFIFCTARAGELINTELNKNMDNTIINIFFTVIAAPILQLIYVRLDKLI